MGGVDFEPRPIFGDEKCITESHLVCLLLLLLQLVQHRFLLLLELVKRRQS